MRSSSITLIDTDIIKADLNDAASCLLFPVFSRCQELLGQHQQLAKPVQHNLITHRHGAPFTHRDQDKRRHSRGCTLPLGTWECLCGSMRSRQRQCALISDTTQL